MTMVDYATTQMPWTLERRRELQRMQIYEPQMTYCPRYHWEDRMAQLENQVRARGRRLPGSDGRAYTSVDEDFSFESEYPRGNQRWRPESQCSQRRQSGIDENLY